MKYELRPVTFERVFWSVAVIAGAAWLIYQVWK
jgi:hypothetical protein